MPLGIFTPGVMFIESTEEYERKFMAPVFPKILQAGYTRFVEPACGGMTWCATAQQAGWPSHTMESSDVMLFSTAVGRGAMGQRMEDLDVRVELEGVSDQDLGDPATVLWAENVARAASRAQTVYWQEVVRALILERERHVEQLNRHLDDYRLRLGGMRYEPMDLFKHLESTIDDPNCLVMLNPPSTAAGYERFFKTGALVSWKQPEYELFDPVAGYERLRYHMEHSKGLICIHEENQGGFEVRNAIIAKGAQRNEKGDRGTTPRINYYVVANRPDEMKQYAGGHGVYVSPPDGHPMQKGDYRLLPAGHPISTESRAEVTTMRPSEASYYRALWTHGFVGSSCPINMAFWLDGYLVGVFGYDPMYLSLGRFGADDDTCMLMYGMTVPQRRYRFNRLLTRLALSRRTLELALPPKLMEKCNVVVTSQMTKHPESKEMRGLMKMSNRSGNPWRGYSLTYRAPIAETDWPQALELWLRDERRWQKARSKG